MDIANVQVAFYVKRIREDGVRRIVIQIVLRRLIFVQQGDGHSSSVSSVGGLVPKVVRSLSKYTTICALHTTLKHTSVF